MKVLLVSDSHGNNAVLDEVIEKHRDADSIVHCGDIECDEFVYSNLLTVRGNNDYWGDFPERRILHFGNHRVLVMHSHQTYFRQRLEYLSRMAREENCDIVFYGHTHVASDDVCNGVQRINPGSLRYNRDGRPISYAIVEINDTVEVNFYFAPFE